MRTRRKVIAAVACIGLGLVPITVYADDIGNTLDPTVDSVAEIMPLTVGGPSATTRLFVVPRNGDGKNGCTLTGSATLTVSVASSNTAVATVNPNSITFTSCVTAANAPVLTVTPYAQGSATVTLTQTANTTGATFDFAPATFTVSVRPPPNTPPTAPMPRTASARRRRA